MSLMVTGEAVKKIIDKFPDFVAEHNETPWFSMRGMRNRIAHGYFDLNLGTVWIAVQESLPDLLEKLPSTSGDETRSDEAG
jgi:uncharacterized protein with HEPN domain